MADEVGTVDFLTGCFGNVPRDVIVDLVRKNPEATPGALCDILLKRQADSRPESSEAESLTSKRSRSPQTVPDPSAPPTKRRRVRRPSSRSRFLASVHENRILAISSNPPSYFRKNRRLDAALSRRVGHARGRKRNAKRLIDSVRDLQSKKWQRSRGGRSGGRSGGSNRKKMMTLSDLPSSSSSVDGSRNRGRGVLPPDASTSRHGSMHTLQSSLYDPRKIGIESLRLTNEFRRSHSLPALSWSEELWKIGLKHSQDMGNGSVPFGHAGFDGRVDQMRRSLRVRNAAENVAYTSRVADIAKQTVDGWIASPGHRKNMLSSQTLCAISVVENARGLWYLTQLFCRE